MKTIASTPLFVEDMDISIRCLNILKSNNVTRVGQLIRLTTKDLLSFRNANKRTVAEVTELLSDYGLKLKES